MYADLLQIIWQGYIQSISLLEFTAEHGENRKSGQGKRVHNLGEKHQPSTYKVWIQSPTLQNKETGSNIKDSDLLAMHIYLFFFVFLFWCVCSVGVSVCVHAQSLVKAGRCCQTSSCIVLYHIFGGQDIPLGLKVTNWLNSLYRDL